MGSRALVCLFVVVCLGGCKGDKPMCTPGAQVACACPGGGSGAQACAANGASLGPCVCAPSAPPAPVKDQAPPKEEAKAAPAKAGKRMEPAGDLNPTVVTQRMMRSIATDKWPLARFVDRGRGVLLVEHWSNVGPGPSEIKRTKHLCAAELQKRLPKLKEELAGNVKDGEALRCSNVGGHSRTSPGFSHNPSSRYVFADDPAKGLMLDAIVVVSEAAMTDAYTAAADKYIKAQLEKGRDRKCPQ